MRIAIVNDLKMAVEILRRALDGVPDGEIAWIAADGAEAVDKCAADMPDLVLMDLIMPVMDGAEATRRIMAAHPACAILVVTATVSGNAGLVFEAMGAGALDAVCTPTFAPDGSIAGRDALLGKIATVAKLLRRPGMQSTIMTRTPTVVLQPAPALPPSAAAAAAAPPLILLGTSTGGPVLLGEILKKLPRDFPAGIVIVQHVDPQFAEGLATWLASQSALPVRLAVAGDRIIPGTVLLAGTERHLIMTPGLRLDYSDEPRDCPFRPSVDALFESTARHWPAKGLAALLTGMGRDGAKGLLRLRQAGWHTLAQDEASSVVYGMPKAAAEIDAAVDVLPAAAIPGALTAWCARKAATS